MTDNVEKLGRGNAAAEPKIKLDIVVNSKPFDETTGVRKRMSGRDIAALVSATPDSTEVFQIKPGPDKDVPLGETIEIHKGEEFRVIRKDVKGGFEPDRVKRELAVLASGGGCADFISDPAAVIYRAVPTRLGYQLTKQTDVLVQIPNGYPGQQLDGAYLPVGSALLGKVAGNPQGAFVTADGRQWQLVSYHPHSGGGAPPWDKDKHGFHTYFDEILNWVQRAQN